MVASVSKVNFESIINKNDQILFSYKLKSGTIGNYQSYWFSPGGWSVKLFGNGVTIIYEPLEKGILIDKKFKTKLIKPNKYDILFKPGFYNQMIGFKKLFQEWGVPPWERNKTPILFVENNILCIPNYCICENIPTSDQGILFEFHAENMLSTANKEQTSNKQSTNKQTNNAQTANQQQTTKK